MGGSSAIQRGHAVALDACDPLAPFRERFVFADEGVIYFDGNSLGRLPRDTPERMSQVIRNEWGSRLIRGWGEGWMTLPTTLGDQLGRSLLGAAPGQVAVADSTTVCFYKLAAAALSARPGRTEIITDTDNFPTDRYVLESLAAASGREIVWLEVDRTGGPEVSQVAEVLGPQTALVSLSHVSYRSAQVAEMAAITRLAHEVGALALWDLSHSAGSVPVTLDSDGVDLAVGCTYKYLNGGPGSPAWLYVRREHQGELRQPIWGWLGRREPFEMAPSYEPSAGIEAMLSGTPPVLGLTAASVGIGLVIEAGIERIRSKSVALTDYGISLFDEWFAGTDCRMGSPRESARRGSHLAVVHPRARALSTQLIDDGVIVDFRAPDVIRLGLSPLTTRFTDVFDGLSQLRELVSDSE